MKTRFTTIDLKAAIEEIQKSNAIGLRVFNVYDIDNKTYLLRLTHGDVKVVILVESGNRIHLTEYDWPKNMMPSGFSMKCRKHLKGRRLASIKQLGVDRIVDFTFGYDEAAYHLIVELYDRGNIVLTDCNYQVLQLLRSRTDTDKDVKFAVREVYPVEHVRQYEPLMDKKRLQEILLQSKPGDNLKRTLNPLFIFGSALLDHCLICNNIQPNSKLLQQFKPDNEEEMDLLMKALHDAETVFNSTNTKGYIIQKKEKRVQTNKDVDKDEEDLLTYTEFHPFLFTQHEKSPYVEHISFNKCVDDFFSKLEGQKFEMKALQIEKAALKRLENVKQDHETRLKTLKESQGEDTRKAELIEINLPLVEQAIATINSAIANQIDWEEINEIVEEAKSQGDPVASAIKSLKLQTNQIELSLKEPFADTLSDSDDESSDDDDNQNKIKKTHKQQKPLTVSIDLSLTAFANARRKKELHKTLTSKISLHNKRRQAASKEQKTIQASKKALKSAEQKTKETLKEVQTSKLISKTRKTYWFEKFYWFISSENYLVIGGRDQQQNELVVKRYLRPGDLYVHADLHGASSVIIKNHKNGEDVPPKTLNEAGTMAICYSAAWEARVVTSAWWVHHHQVSKTAPSGEYLTTGSFMIRGKKNYLPPSYLIMGFSVLFKLDESCVSAHLNDRKVRTIEENIDKKLKEEVEEEKDEEEGDEISLNENGSEAADDDDEGDDDDDDNGGVDEQSESSDSFSEKPVSSSSFNNTDNKIDENKPSIEETNESIQNEVKGEEDTIKQGDSSEVEPQQQEEMFPDTSIQLQHVSGETFQLHRGISSASTQPDDDVNNGDNDNDDDDEHFIELGDGEKIRVGKQVPEEKGTSQDVDVKNQNRKPKLSAKQRRDLKKKKNKLEDVTETDSKATTNNIEKKEVETKKKEKTSNPEPLQQQQKKRGQKEKGTSQDVDVKNQSKNKKMKEKYKDQDDEDRELMQQILRSHEAEKPPKKKGKEKRKEKEKQQQQQQQQQQNKQQQNKKQQNQQQQQQPEILHAPDENPDNHKENKQTLQRDEADDDGEENNEDFDKENISILDSLTGCPLGDDILLYAIPVCAPYTCLQNYKFKVKITPGTGKRGRAAKTALGMFQASKETKDWEKDLLKALKDVDISRNIPGKVKLSAPNLQKAKKK